MFVTCFVLSLPQKGGKVYVSHHPNEIGISQKIHKWCITHNERGVRWRDSHQLLEVVLHRVGINHHTNGYQRVKGKVEDLVAEEWNDPSRMLLRGTDGGGKRRHVVNNKVRMLSIFVHVVYLFTLYAPYVAMPHIRIMSRDIAVAMQISAGGKHTWREDRLSQLISRRAANASFHQNPRFFMGIH